MIVLGFLIGSACVFVAEGKKGWVQFLIILAGLTLVLLGCLAMAWSYS